MNGHEQAREILKNLTNRAKGVDQGPDDIKKHLLIVLTGKADGLEAALREIPRLKRYGFSVDLALSTCAEKILNEKKIVIPLQVGKIFTVREESLACKAIDVVQRVIVPAMTQNTAIKLSMGIQDEFIPRLLWQCLWKGKPLLVNLEQLLCYRGMAPQQPFLEEMMKEYIEKLQKMGVKPLSETAYGLELIEQDEDPTQKGQKVSHEKIEGKPLSFGERQVITEKDISLVPGGQKQMTLPLGTIITPLAYDKAKEKGIQLIKG
ncbi:hypothetical protein Amet_4576 [Alkaliphilus metalliredigens QYMF]|uniref:Flavoprotein domain-containing protein n=1 Tax=Alkaliphilus metalliredigens (strain QYMF) TaxID=293826 RepID=A6TWS9_ALKMQ|nr:flavoprotein [Alkaliphilus metalliredigens]ABR50647.1 hypothetical protein Amet_4576 [Alkaliphilus metalliredigens QYMF]